jgi:hypothetical protein
MGLENASQSKYVFGEHLNANLKNVEIDSLLENGACKYSLVFTTWFGV